MISKFAAQVANDLYKDSDEDPEDKSWGPKEWLTLLLASGALAGVGALGYHYRNQIGDALSGTIGGSNKSPLEKATGAVGTTPMAAGAILGGASSALAPIRKSFIGDASRNSTVHGIARLADDDQHPLSKTVRENLGNAFGNVVIDSGLEGKHAVTGETAAENAVRMINAGATARNSALALANTPNYYNLEAVQQAYANPTGWQGTADTLTGRLLTNTSNKLYSPTRTFTGVPELNALDTHFRDTERLVGEARTMPEAQWRPEHRAALDYDAKFHREGGFGQLVDPAKGYVVDHARAIKPLAFSGALNDAMNVTPPVTAGNTVKRIGVGALFGVGANFGAQALGNWYQGAQ